MQKKGLSIETFNQEIMAKSSCLIPSLEIEQRQKSGLLVLHHCMTKDGHEDDGSQPKRNGHGCKLNLGHDG